MQRGENGQTRRGKGVSEDMEPAAKIVGRTAVARLLGAGASAKKAPLLLGMIHLPALPGTPNASLPLSAICRRAMSEATIYAEAELDGVIVENMHDLPYLRGQVGPEITSAVAVTVDAVCRRIGQARRESMLVGVQILAGANKEALAVANACGADFIRAESLVYGHLADEGWMDASAGELMRFRRSIGAERVAIFADIQKKHASHAVSSDINIGTWARTAEFCLADGIVVTGTETGSATSLKDVKQAREATQLPVLVGSGVTPLNLETVAKSGANALIVGSHFKKDGHWAEVIEEQRVREMVKALRSVRFV